MTPQEAAELCYPIFPNKFGDKDEWLPEEIKKLERSAFIAGHQARDVEVEKLVEALRAIKNEDDRSFWQSETMRKIVFEALKPYQSPVTNEK